MTKQKLGTEYLTILNELREGAKAGAELSAKLDIPREVMAGRLAPLVRWGCIRESRLGLYEITDKGLEAIQTGMRPSPPQPPPELPPEPPKIESISSHEEAEAALLQTGNLLGFNTYTADPSKECRDVKLGDLAATKDVPPFTYERLLKTVKEIDVIWFKEGFPRYCFEVEHTTGVRDGLLRLYSLRELNTKFFIVAPQNVVTRFKTEILKDPFYIIKERYNFKTYEELTSFHNAVVKYHHERSKFGIEL